MAVIRCPNCGKPNPEFLDVCQYCDTPLQEPAAPGSAAVTPAAAQPAAPAEGGAEQGVFTNLRATTKAPDEGAEAQPMAELPDWLSRLGGAEPAPAQPENQTKDTTGKLSSWLDTLGKGEPEAKADSRDWYWTGTQGEGETSATPAATPAPTGELPDWLRSIGASAPTQAAPEEAGLPDWLQGISAATAAQPEPLQPAAPTPAEELPGWLHEFSNAPAEQPQPPQAAAAPPPSVTVPTEELPDWLDEFGATSSGQTETSHPAAPFSGEAQIETTPATADEIPDWLQSVGTTAAQQPEAAQPAAPSGAALGAATPAAGDELPEWLRTAGPTTAPAEQEALALGEVPDWLQSLDSATPEQPTVAAPATPPQPEATPVPEEDLPAWLRSIGTGTPAAAVVPPAEARPTAWLGTPGAVQGGPALIAPEMGAEEQPEWLQDLGISPALPAAAAPAGAFASDEQPEWLRSLGVTAPSAGQPASVSPLEPTGAEQTEWIGGPSPAASPTPAPETSGGVVSPFGAGEVTLPEATSEKLPEWLTNIAPAQQPGGLQPAAATENRLAPFALPSWLEAMRPVEVPRPTIMPEVDDYEETAGVLAGLRGVLRAQPDIAQPGKSAIQVQKLEVTEAQTKQANLLARTLAPVSEAHRAAKRSFWLALPVERLAVFAVLFLAFVTPLIFPEARNFFTPAQSWNPSALDTFNILDNLSPAQPALVAFDYDPAQEGELDPLAHALVAHLQRRGVPVVGISTSPAGAATGEALLNQVFDPAAYGSQYVNLGYLPGGPVGMLQITNGLRPLLTVDFRGSPAVWETAVLTHTRQLSDFGVIVLVSATPDTVRAWVEQLQSYSSKPPLIAAVSAGAEPLVRPYYNTDPAQRQLQGLVSGILGAAQYERQSGVPGLASGEMWDVLGWGLLVVIVLLIGGNLFYGLVGIMRRQKR